MTKYQDIALMLEANAITNTVDAYEKGRTDAIDEVVGNIIEEIEEIKKWYEGKYKEINDVQICIVLEDLNNLINELKENNNEIN